MKTLKIKLSFFSLLAILAVSVFLTSCEQEQEILPDVIEDVNELNVSDDGVLFTLPEQFDNMSEEELNAFFEGVSHEDLLALGTIVPTQEIEDRWCSTGWLYLYSYCKTFQYYPYSRRYFVFRRWCNNRWIYKTVAGPDFC